MGWFISILLMTLTILVVGYVWLFWGVIKGYIENLPTKKIAVISKSYEDFQQWRDINGLYPSSSPDNDDYLLRSRFRVGNFTYICITDVLDACSWKFDEVTETSKASENENYDTLKEEIKLQT